MEPRGVFATVTVAVLEFGGEARPRQNHWSGAVVQVSEKQFFIAQSRDGDVPINVQPVVDLAFTRDHAAVPARQHLEDGDLKGTPEQVPVVVAERRVIDSRDYRDGDFNGRQLEIPEQLFARQQKRHVERHDQCVRLPRSDHAEFAAPEGACCGRQREAIAEHRDSMRGNQRKPERLPAGNLGPFGRLGSFQFIERSRWTGNVVVQLIDHPPQTGKAIRGGGA
ncbi:MAG: hypothetical protein JWN34_3652 [Bryobacterales bacterium]|nr:hypothetical protein [Bryobacterales bacterium]